MLTLTAQQLNAFPYSRYADAQTLQRGRNFFEEGRVWSVEMQGLSKAVCSIYGDTGDYLVEIQADPKTGKLSFECDCPYAEEGHFCKHKVAAGLELSVYLEGITEEEELTDVDRDDRPILQQPSSLSLNSWRNKIESLIVQAPSSAPSSTRAQPYAAVFLIWKSESYYQELYSYAPCILKAKDWYPLQSLEHGDKQIVENLLDQNDEWLQRIQEINGNVNPAGCLNLTPEALSLLKTFHQYTRFFGSASALVAFFPMLAQLEIPFFLLNKSKKTVLSRLRILPNPVNIQAVFTREAGNLVLSAGIAGEPFAPGEHKVQILSHNPPWLLMDNVIFSLPDASQVSLLSSFPISIPETEADLFRERYLPRVAELLPIQGDLIHWSDIHADPIPRLYLHDDQDNLLRADLHFGYGDYELAATKSDRTQSIEPVPDSWDLIRVHRQPAHEQHFYQLLSDPNSRLKRSNASQPYGTFELRARAHPFDFLLRSIPFLTQAGFEIYGEDNLRLGKINRATPALRVNITSGIDWFDLKTVVEFGDQTISLQEVRKALKHGEHYVKLADGSVGEIPAEWLEKFKHLWNLAQETADGFRVSEFHIPLIDSLLESNAEIQAPPDLAQRAQRLRSFEQIAPQPLPSGFTGELRPYQKHGFDWLHFLREYKFGGILADDMGLGKTIQVLAFLQSLREQGNLQSAVLLVVPKSLVVNWQRESEKFTPGLRFLEYLGNFRVKDTNEFNPYDVILTTYGTMLRDIEILREHKFDYIILDESQAIKNPLAKSTKAACLLQADHRLVMTGTPVENNTFELWSQFAFLNPGLLGSLEYFKREFATPIESKQDEQAAATLRKLVFPFILRRAKEQVATELPPRTERILYTDMDTAQKKLYAKTRERYRAELLGLIDSTGLNDARFKILEGLLRLRQIAIHPALVENNYRGESPKFEVLFETLETLQAEHHKALIFSQFVEILKLIRQELDARKIKYVYLDGKTSDRQARVDLFQNDPSIPFFLISLKAGGVGLNLTAADYVIHLDPWWNPAVEMQASDRAHRIGQDKPVFVYKIIARQTVEEKILQLQERKRDLVKSLIATEANFFKSLTKDDVKMLFE
jgi:non-specific serine/threonine protein kinase